MKDVKITISLNTKPFLTGMSGAVEIYKNFIKLTSQSLSFNVDNTELVNKLDDLKSNIETSLTESANIVESNSAEAMGSIEQILTETHDNIKKTAENTTAGTVKKLGEIGLAINGLKSMFTGIIGPLKNLSNMSNEQAKIYADLSSALKTVNQDCKETIKSYRAFASEIQRTTTIGDTHAIQLLTISANMGVLHEKREEAVRGAIGLAKAFENAGLSQETALKGIALAYEGNFSMLQRYIPELRSAGTEAEKMAILQEKMANGFQMAKDETQTGAGAMAQFGNIVGDLKEHVGDMINTALVPLVKILTKVAVFLDKNKALFQALVGAVTIFGLALAKKQIILIGTNSLLALKTIKVTALAIAYKTKTIALGAVTIATKVYTAAQWLLNIALAANPIGAMVAIIIAAIAVIVALTMAVVKLFKAFKKNKKETQEPMVEQSQLDEDLSMVEDHLKKREQAIRDSYRTQRDEISKQYREKKISELEFMTKLRELTNAELNEIYGLHKDNFEREIALTEKKIKVGKATHEELKKIVSEYYEWIKSVYGEDSEEYLDALDKKLDGEREHRDKLQKLKDNLDTFRKSLRTQEQVLSDSYNEQLKQQREFLDNKLLSEAEYWENLKLIKQKYDTELQKIDLQKQRDDLALVERKLALGLATNDELKNQLNNYEEYILQHYSTDSAEYLSMLEKKQSVHKKFTDDAKKELDSYSRQWSEVVKDFQNKRIDLSQLQTEFARLNANLQEIKETANDPIEIDVIVNKMSNQLDDIEEKDITQRRTVVFEFENAQLSNEDPELARMQAQIRALEDYYDKHREMLIQAGIEETAIDEQIAKERQAIEEAFQMARYQTVSSATGKLLGDIAKSGVVSFETGKALQIAQLLIETPAAAFAAYRSMIGIPFVGPALAPVAFATAMATGMVQIANIKKQKPPKAEKGGLTGLLSGKSHSQGGILIEAEGNEYITNKKRVSELGKNFFDFINFAPLETIKKAFSNISLPPLNIPTMPKFAYASGGYVSGNSYDFRALESRMDTLIDKVMDGFDNLNAKDYNIHIKSHMNGVKYIREHNRYQEEYNRKTK